MFSIFTDPYAYFIQPFCHCCTANIVSYSKLFIRDKLYYIRTTWAGQWIRLKIQFHRWLDFRFIIIIIIKSRFSLVDAAEICFSQTILYTRNNRKPIVREIERKCHYALSARPLCRHIIIINWLKLRANCLLYVSLTYSGLASIINVRCCIMNWIEKRKKNRRCISLVFADTAE